MSDSPISAAEIAGQELIARGYGVYEPEPRWDDHGFPEPVSGEAYHGLAEEFVTAVMPYTEGDPTAVLAQLLTAYGSAVGRRPHYLVGGTRHHPNLFVGVVGATGEGRKGSGADVVSTVMSYADPAWHSDCVVYGLSTGEGIIKRVGDDASDKRLFCLESEFSRPLRAAAREGNTLSMVIRQAWDGQTLQTLTRNDPLRASGAHVSLVGHTTPADLRRYLADVDVLNGFANRFVWVASRRSKALPEAPGLPKEVVSDLGGALGRKLATGRLVDRMHRDERANGLWGEVYPTLSRGAPGAWGAATGRAEAQVLRLSMVYALLDGRAVIEVFDLRAALALWDYCERTALWVFGAGTGNRDADYLLGELRAVYPESLRRTELRDLLGRSRPVEPALDTLADQELAFVGKGETTKRGGRPAEFWTANPEPPVSGVRSVLCRCKPKQEGEGEGGTVKETTHRPIDITDKTYHALGAYQSAPTKNRPNPFADLDEDLW